MAPKLCMVTNAELHCIGSSLIHRVDLVRETEKKVKVSPWKKIFLFGRKGKLSLRFIGPYEIIERIGPVVYRLALPTELEKLHNEFHVSMLVDIDQILHT
ncbi:DNA/RNA polymerases superfamily protein [Gossypium australe]|uniref:DNA/RNA polymerases superfamily protein n=1 Tax=Gossypium australe TaxID=47621 RepID=A0A5B6WRP0_9ROSI|nr:DNA/RNA polymerases superfamily protein [Gossypium australe]